MNRPKQADVATLRARLAADEWLKPAETAALFGVSRWAVIDWIKAGRIGVRKLPSGYRLCDPTDVTRLLVEFEQTHKAEPGEESPQ